SCHRQVLAAMWSEGPTRGRAPPSASASFEKPPSSSAVPSTPNERALVRRRARRDAVLGEQQPQMRADGPRAHLEDRGNLFVGKALCDEANDLTLAGREPLGILIALIARRRLLSRTSLSRRCSAHGGIPRSSSASPRFNASSSASLVRSGERSLKRARTQASIAIRTLVLLAVKTCHAQRSSRLAASIERVHFSRGRWRLSAVNDTTRVRILRSSAVQFREIS